MASLASEIRYLLPTSSRSRFSSRNIKSQLDTLSYHSYSIWLFTRSDLKTIIVPSTAFAVLHKFGSQSLELNTSETITSTNAIRILVVLAWTWINLLPFTIDNQRQASGVEEDRHNKPWRPLPSERMTPEQATKLMLVLYPIAVVISIYLKVYAQSLILVGLGVWYNDLKGADVSWQVRNLINAAGFVCYTSGALRVLLQQEVFHSSKLVGWFTIIAGIVFSTVQTQDMYDQAGDMLRNRKTLPLVLGDGFARWTIAIPMLCWSCICPAYWTMPVFGYVVPLTLGCTIAFRTLTRRSVQQDKTTFLLWNLWLVVLYSLPLVRTWLV